MSSVNYCRIFALIYSLFKKDCIDFRAHNVMICEEDKEYS